MRRIALIGDSITDRIYAQGVTGLHDAQNKQQGGQGIDEYLQKMLRQSTVENFGISGAYIGSGFRENLPKYKLQYRNITLDSNDPTHSSYHHLSATFDSNLLGYIKEQAFDDVIIMLGTNDITLSPQPLFDDIGNILSNMIDILLGNKKTRVHLFAPPNRKTPHDNQPAFVETLRTVAALKKDNVRFTGLHIPTDIPHQNFVDEGLGIHPNTLGLESIAKDMYNKIFQQKSVPVPTPMTPRVTPTQPVTQYPADSSRLPASGADVWLDTTRHVLYAYSWFPIEPPPGRRGRLVVHEQSPASPSGWKGETPRITEMHMWGKGQGQVIVSENNQPRSQAMALQVVAVQPFNWQLKELIDKIQQGAPGPHVPGPYVPSPHTVVPNRPVDKVIVCIGDSLIDSFFAKSKRLTTSVPAELKLLFDKAGINARIIDLAHQGTYMTNYLDANCGGHNPGKDMSYQSTCSGKYKDWITNRDNHVTDFLIMLGTNDILADVQTKVIGQFKKTNFLAKALELIELCSARCNTIVFKPPHFVSNFHYGDPWDKTVTDNRDDVNEGLVNVCRPPLRNCRLVETPKFGDIEFLDGMHFKEQGMRRLANSFYEELTGSSAPVDPSDPSGPLLPFVPPAFTPPAFTTPNVPAQEQLPFTNFPESREGTFDMYQVIGTGYFFTYRNTNDKNTSVSLYNLDTSNMTFMPVPIPEAYATPLMGTKEAGGTYTIQNIFGGSAGTLRVKMQKMQFKHFKDFRPPSEGPPSQGPPAPAVVLPQPTQGQLPYTSSNRDNPTIQIYKVMGTNLELYFTYTDPYTVALYQEIRGSLEKIRQWPLQEPLQAAHLGDETYGQVTNFIHSDLGREIQIQRIDMDSTRLLPAVIQPVPVVPQPVMQPAVPLPMVPQPVIQPAVPLPVVPQPVMQPVVPPFGRPAQPLPADPSFVVLPKSSEGAIYKIDDTKGFVWVPGEGFSGNYTEVVKDGDHWQKSKSQKRTVRYTRDEDLLRAGEFLIRMDGKEIVVKQVHGVQFKEYSEERNLFEKVWDGIKDFFDLEWYFIVFGIVGVCVVLAFVYVCFKVMLQKI